jgi:hypothetical protein
MMEITTLEDRGFAGNGLEIDDVSHETMDV